MWFFALVNHINEIRLTGTILGKQSGEEARTPVPAHDGKQP